jgi:hypothetical protein
MRKRAATCSGTHPLGKNKKHPRVGTYAPLDTHCSSGRTLLHRVGLATSTSRPDRHPGGTRCGSDSWRGFSKRRRLPNASLSTTYAQGWQSCRELRARTPIARSRRYKNHRAGIASQARSRTAATLIRQEMTNSIAQALFWCALCSS